MQDNTGPGRAECSGRAGACVYLNEMFESRFLMPATISLISLPFAYLAWGVVGLLLVLAYFAVIGAIVIRRVKRGLPADGRADDSADLDKASRFFRAARVAIIGGIVFAVSFWVVMIAIYPQYAATLIAFALISTVVPVAVSLAAILRPAWPSGNFLKVLLMGAFGYVLMMPVVVAWVLISRAAGTGPGPALVMVLPAMLVGGFVVRWREQWARANVAAF